jgi:hypothetical protein
VKHWYRAWETPHGAFRARRPLLGIHAQPKTEKTDQSLEFREYIQPSTNLIKP